MGQELNKKESNHENVYRSWCFTDLIQIDGTKDNVSLADG